MADEQNENQPQDDEQVTLNRSQIRSMEQDAKDARTLRKEMAFLKAGIDTDKGVGSLAFKSYDGEPTVEAVKAFAEEYGLTGTTEPAEPVPTEATQGYAPGETEATELRRAVSTGAGVDDGSEHPSEAALRVGNEALKTRTSEDALVAAIVTKATAAKNGDKRALVAERPR